MGFAIAEAALKRGGEVTVVAGITTAATPPPGSGLCRRCRRKRCRRLSLRRATHASVFIGAAAIADYRPAQRAEQKIKKSNDSITLTLERTPDVCRRLQHARTNGMLVIGFAAETENVIDNAREKLRSKNLDAIIANDVTRADSGFDSATNAITIITRDNDPVELPVMSKSEAADRILDVIVSLR